MSNSDSAASGFSSLAASLYRSAFGRDLLHTLMSRSIVLVLGLGTGIAVARYLGPEGRGLFAIATIVTALGVQFGNLGLHAANTYLVASTPDRLPALIGNSLVVAAALGATVITAAALIANVWPAAVSLEGTLWILALAGIPFGIAHLLMQNLLLGVHAFAAFNLVELLGRAVAAVLIAAALLAGLRTPEWMIAASLIATMVALQCSFASLKSRTKEISFSIRTFMSGVGYGSRAYLAAMLSFLQQRIALLLVQQQDVVSEVGHFSVALMIFDLAYVIPVTVGTILFPRLSAMPSVASRWKLTRLTLWMVGTVMLIVAAVLGLFADPIVRLLFGADFGPAARMLQWLLPGLLFLSISTVLISYLGSNHMHPVVIYAPAAALMSMLLSFTLIQDMPVAQRAAFSTSLGYAVMLLVTSAHLFRQRGKR